MSSPSWNKPYFECSRALSANSSDEISSSGNSNPGDSERWVYISALINGIQVYAYGLFSGFGKGNSFLSFVSKNLVSQLLNSSQFADVLSKFDREQANGNIKYIDEQIIALLKSAFINIDADYSEECQKYIRKMSRMKMNDEIISLDSFSLSEPHSNGCSALLAVIIKDRLFIGNLGNSAAILCKQLNEPKEMILFQVSDSHVDHERITDLNSLPNKCFGGFDQHSETFEPICDPSIANQGIQLDHTIQFLLFASPFALKIVTQMNLENLDNVNTHLVSMIVDDFNNTRSIGESLKNVVNRLQEKFIQINRNPKLKPNIALAYIDLQNNYDVEQLPESSQQQTDSQANAISVDSEVDWSDFDRHDLRDVFTATVNSLKQELSIISEH